MLGSNVTYVLAEASAQLFPSLDGCKALQARPQLLGIEQRVVSSQGVHHERLEEHGIVPEAEWRNSVSWDVRRGLGPEPATHCVCSLMRPVCN